MPYIYPFTPSRTSFINAFHTYISINNRRLFFKRILSAGKASVKDEKQKKQEAKFNTKNFIEFPQVASQKKARWGNIKREDLVWYGSFPALVVPPSLYVIVNSQIQIPTHSGILAYGPSAKDIVDDPKTQRELGGMAEGGKRSLILTPLYWFFQRRNVLKSIKRAGGREGAA